MCVLASRYHYQVGEKLRCADCGFQSAVHPTKHRSLLVYFAFDLVETSLKLSTHPRLESLELIYSLEDHIFVLLVLSPMATRIVRLGAFKE